MSDRRRGPTYREYRRHRLWLLACNAALEQAYADRLTVGFPTEEEKASLYFDTLTIKSAVEDQLAFSASRMQHGDEREQETVAEMLRHFRRALSALPMIARHIDLAETTVRVADERGAGIARVGRSRRTNERLGIARTSMAKARREAGDTPPDHRALLDTVDKALRAADHKMSEATLKRYVDTVTAEEYGLVLPE